MARSTRSSTIRSILGTFNCQAERDARAEAFFDRLPIEVRH